MHLKSDASVEYRFGLMVELRKEGKSQAAIAKLLGCSQAWVSRVLKRHREEGRAALKVRHGQRGRATRLAAAQLKRLTQLLAKGALRFGFPTDNWTRERIALLIQERFSVTYHPSHISKLMRRLGFTLQKPRRRSFKKDEARVKRWRERTLPRLKKKGPPGRPHPAVLG